MYLSKWSEKKSQGFSFLVKSRNNWPRTSWNKEKPRGQGDVLQSREKKKIVDTMADRVNKYRESEEVGVEIDHTSDTLSNMIDGLLGNINEKKDDKMELISNYDYKELISLNQVSRKAKTESTLDYKMEKGIQLGKMLMSMLISGNLVWSLKNTNL